MMAYLDCHCPASPDRYTPFLVLSKDQKPCGPAWEYSVWQPPTKVGGEALPHFKSLSYFDSGAAHQLTPDAPEWKPGRVSAAIPASCLLV